MKITVIHGQSHKGVTYTMTKEVLNCLANECPEVREFFLPNDGPDFCRGCNACFMKGETHCPAAEKVQPIALSIKWADVIILDSPNYVMEMSGPMKNLMDHLAYRWVTHRPHGKMFTKIGVAVSSSAGAPPNGVVKSMAKQLKWMGISKVYRFPFICKALGVADLKPQKRAELERKAALIAKKVRKHAANTYPSLRGKLLFSIFRRMQSAPGASWNPTDRDWWIGQGWTKKVRPWQKNQEDPMRLNQKQTDAFPQQRRHDE